MVKQSKILQTIDEIDDFIASCKAAPLSSSNILVNRDQIESLVDRVKQGEVSEVILALSTTMEGDTTNFYIFRKLAQFPQIKITTLARGVSVGDEIEYADEITLGKSISNRVLFSDNFGKNV